jgi:cytochrome c oxidase cbb3-type subunit 3
VGPNLTDDYWIHGCSINDIYNIIVVGVPEKGMISWKDQLTPEQIQQVSSFILTLVGTDPPNPKEPQGEKCES